MMQSEQPLISIIVPVYNVRPYLQRCADSILNQTHRNLEIILVDDGSSDGSGDLCDIIAQTDTRVRVIHKENGGASSARNRGLDTAHGDYIGFVDADDYITEDMYAYLLELMYGEGADIAMCSFTRDPVRLETGGENGTICRICGRREIKDFFYRVHGEPSFYAVWNRLYKRIVIESVRFIEGIITEDVAFTYETCCNANTMVISDRKKYLYFRNENGVTRSRLMKKDLALLDIWDRIIEKETDALYREWAVKNRMRAEFTLYVKGRRYGRSDDISEETMKEWKTQICRNYKKLMEGAFLPLSRKLILTMIKVGLL